jgi:AAA15 family ATPase/GTPase
MLVWAWNEHVEASKLLGKEPQRNIVLLVDEMESHLHPFWQRAITPALMDVIKVLDEGTRAQLLLSTHSPLVLASVENRFDPEVDRLFHIYMQEQEVKLDSIPFVKRGRVDLWLMSDLFGLKQPRSKAAEEVIEEAKRLQQIRETSKEKILEVTEKLKRVLAEDDEFWPRWIYFAEEREVVL